MKTTNQNSKKSKLVVNKLTKKQKEFAIGSGLGIAGLFGGVFGIMKFARADYDSKVVEVKEAVDAKEAFAMEDEPITAEDLDIETNMTADPKQLENSVSFEIHTNAPVASSINDAMLFPDAFSTARAEVNGGGGFFQWKGDIFNTYTQEEWNAMSPEQKLEYWKSINEVSELYSVDASGELDLIDYSAGVDNAQLEYVISEADIIEKIDYSQDGINDGYIVDINDNGIDDLVVDFDGDGQIDELILDFENIHDGTIETHSVNALPANLEPGAKRRIEITEDSILESADITGNSEVEAFVVDVDGNEHTDFAFDSNASGDIDVVVVDMGTPEQEVIEIDAVAITDRMYEVQVDFDKDLISDDLDTLSADEEFDIDTENDLDADMDMDFDVDIDLNDIG